MDKNYDILSILESKQIDLDMFIMLIFENYQKRKKEGNLYSKDNYIPQNIIKAYYSEIDNPRFDSLVNKFKNNYIKNENEIENVHEKCEREGLEVAYDYIHNEKRMNNINIYTVLRLHQLIYSKAPHPEFGGKLRNQPIFLPNSGVETEDWSFIPQKLNELYLPTQDLIKRGLQLKNDKISNIDNIIEYIDECVELKCKLIKMHPFLDGNGRSIRAFTNLLFIIADIPPIYIKAREREEYGKVMNMAIVDGDLTQIKRFYYYKICDSIYELDIKPKLSQEVDESVRKKS
ncbi:MAG: Fic family protein [Bacilli bacterium]|nr:Fic family protein [Bacilli bacterium]